MKEGRKPEYPEKTPDDELQTIVRAATQAIVRAATLRQTLPIKLKQGQPVVALTLYGQVPYSVATSS